MLLEIENQLTKRVHTTLGQNAVVIRLAEELDKSGKVAEKTMVIVSWSGGNTKNPYEGGYIPTVRNRTLNYSITIIQNQLQREGHSFALPLMDLIYDAVTGWVPEVQGLEFRTGFEPGAERFVEVTDSSQFIYEMNFSINVSLSDGRFFSQPCAAFDDVYIGDFLPQRSCLMTSDKKTIGLAIWRRKTSSDTNEEFIVEDTKCPKALGDVLEVSCSSSLDGSATYRFIPRAARSRNSAGIEVFNESLIISGTLQKVYKCYKGNTETLPPWFKLNVDTGIWKNVAGTIPNTDPNTSALQEFKVITSSPEE
jgi:hypothetical protein